jgi:hypothetical protein
MESIVVGDLHVTPVQTNTTLGQPLCSDKRVLENKEVH